ESRRRAPGGRLPARPRGGHRRVGNVGETTHNINVGPVRRRLVRGARSELQSVRADRCWRHHLGKAHMIEPQLEDTRAHLLDDAAGSLGPDCATFVILSFEGPDPYARAGGLGVRVSELSLS